MLLESHFNLDAYRWFDFIHEAVTIVQKENPELKVNEWTIKEAVKTYMTTIARTVREGNEARIAGNLRAAPASRKTKVRRFHLVLADLCQLEEHMATAFHVSALARCKESSWYRLAFVDSKNRYLDLWKKEEGHDMVCSFPNPNDGNIDLDGFILLSDLWHQRRTDVGEFYLARAPEWWSDEVSLAHRNPLTPLSLPWRSGYCTRPQYRTPTSISQPVNVLSSSRLHILVASVAQSCERSSMNQLQPQRGLRGRFLAKVGGSAAGWSSRRILRNTRSGPSASLKRLQCL